jgi:hypothetical protein
MRARKTFLAAVSAAALAVAPAALANNGNHFGQINHPNHGSNGNHGSGNNGNAHNPSVMYVFKGTYGGDGTTVNVTGGNNHVKKASLVGTAVMFDFTNAKIVVADTNADGNTDLTDAAAGDAVVVKAKLPKADAGTQPFVAKQLVDQTHPEESSDDTTETPETPTA